MGDSCPRDRIHFCTVTLRGVLPDGLLLVQYAHHPFTFIYSLRSSHAEYSLPVA